MKHDEAAHDATEQRAGDGEHESGEAQPPAAGRIPAAAAFIVGRYLVNCQLVSCR